MRLSAAARALKVGRGEPYFLEDKARIIAILDALQQEEETFFDDDDDNFSEPPAPFIKRRRKPIEEIFAELGPALTRRAYRMTEASFWKLHTVLLPHLVLSCSGEDKALAKKKHRNGAKNGLIPTQTRLSVALRYYAGGQPEDIMLVHGISFSEVFRSLWLVADAVNSCDSLAFSYPTDHNTQRAIAAAFEARSQAGFKCCGGVVDCMLAWTEKPLDSCCEEAKCGPKKFYCGRKKKFGLCMQAIADASCCFLDVP